MEQPQLPLKPKHTEPSVSLIALGGMEDVTRNMYLYEYNNQILIVDCGLGFPDETALGINLLLPDSSYLVNLLKDGKKKIVGMVFTHGHEDHIGGIPFILPQFMSANSTLGFPLYASPLTAALANEKLKEYKIDAQVQTVQFTDKEIKLGDFKITFVRVTHSVPDSANIIINTPIGNLFHGSDFKFDMTPVDGKRSEFLKITKAAQEGVIALMSDCLGSDKEGFSISEEKLGNNIEREMRDCPGKFIVTTYSSNISRMNQVIKAAEKVGRKVCFVGRSMLKVKQIGERLGYLHMLKGTEVTLPEINKFKSRQLVFMVAGSQGQENSAMTRIAEGEHRDVKLDALDTVLFSADTIPGNELTVGALGDAISKRGAKVLHSSTTGSGLFHVSGHGSPGDHMLLIALTQPKYLLPISGKYHHMVAYRNNALKMGYKKKDIVLLENGQQIFFTKNAVRFGNKVPIKHVYVDEVSGEEVESFVIRDREKLAREGVAIIMAEVNATDGQLATSPEIIVRGSSLTDTKEIVQALTAEIEKGLLAKKGTVTNWFHVRRLIGEVCERYLYKKLRARPLVLPVVIEV